MQAGAVRAGAVRVSPGEQGARLACCWALGPAVAKPHHRPARSCACPPMHAPHTPAGRATPGRFGCPPAAGAVQFRLPRRHGASWERACRGRELNPNLSMRCKARVTRRGMSRHTRRARRRGGPVLPPAVRCGPAAIAPPAPAPGKHAAWRAGEALPGCGSPRGRAAGGGVTAAAGRRRPRLPPLLHQPALRAASLGNVHTQLQGAVHEFART